MEIGCVEEFDLMMGPVLRAADSAVLECSPES